MLFGSSRESSLTRGHIADVTPLVSRNRAKYYGVLYG